MNLDNEELQATRGMASQEFIEDKLIKQWQLILDTRNLDSDEIELIHKTIKVLGGK